MNFNPHFDLVGKHAFLSASKYHWVNYSEERLVETYLNAMAKERGTALHELAKNCILLGVKVAKTKDAFNMYVNDAIGFKMTPEQVLCYSYYCYGTADAISFRNNVLRIHDLKTGESPADITQLKIYAALFCLEYGYKPQDIETKLCIYQSGNIDAREPSPEDIQNIMDTIVQFSKRLDRLRLEV